MAEEAGYARRLAKGVAAVFTGLVAARLMGFFLRVFIMRTLTPEEYGLFYATFAVVSLFVAFRELGLTPALVKHVSGFMAEKRFSDVKSTISTVLLFQTASSSFIGALFFIFSDQIALMLLKTPVASPLLKILGIWFFFATFYLLLQGVSQGFQRLSFHAVVEFSSIFLVFVSAALLVGILNLGVEGLAVSYLLASIIMLAFWPLFFKKYSPLTLKEKAPLDKSLAKKLLIFGLPLFIGGIFITVAAHASTLMLVAFHSPIEAGLFQMALPIVLVPVYFSVALTTAFFPLVSEMWATGGPRPIAQTLHFIIKFSFILVIPAALILVAFPDIIINLIAGPDYIAGVVALQILAGMVILFTFNKILMTAIAGIGKTVYNMKVAFLVASTVVVGNFLLIPNYSVEGAAATMVLSSAISFMLLIYYARKLIDFRVPVLPLLKTSAGAVLTLALIFFLKSILDLPPLLEAPLVAISALLFYGGWILLTKSLTKGDLAILVRVIPIPKWFIEKMKRFAG